MKKLFTLLFAAAFAIALAMPVVAQDQGAAGSSDQGASTSSSTKKPKKAKKAKKEKKSDTGSAAPQQ